MIRETNEMFAAMYAGAIISCGKWWITKSEKPDKELVIERFAELIFKI